MGNKLISNDVRRYIEKTCSLQKDLNSKIDTNWVDADYHWKTCILVELGELLASSGYKHWKKENQDLDNMKMEVVDVYHFFISFLITSVDDDTSETLAKAIKFYENKYANKNNQYIKNIREDKHLFIEKVNKVSAKLINFVQKEKIDSASVEMIELISLFFDSFEEFYSLYLAKNALNIFRQQHGYKTGEYIKHWRENTEDNVVVSEIIESYKKDSDALPTIEDLLTLMQFEYSKI